MAEKNYVGNGKAITTKYGTMFNMSFKLEDLKKLPVNEKGYIRVTMSELKNPDKFGNTHTCYENDYKDNGKMPSLPKSESAESQDLPF